jgi:fumarate hydratase subunit beta
MDAYTPRLLSLGLRGMIGKGSRSPRVIAAIVEAGAVYFSAIGGAGALLARRVLAARIIAFEDLGAEAVRRLLVKDFPAIVAVDSRGEDLYRTGRKAYLDSEQRAGGRC